MLAKLQSFLAGVFLAIACAAPARADAPTTQPLQIASPKDYQVFQRQTRDRGDALIKVRLDDAQGSLEQWILECRFTGAGGKPVVPGRSLQFDPGTREFAAKVQLPAGGWYRFEVSLARPSSAEPLARAVVEHVGIGEVFVVAGQSNSTNYGSAPQKPQSGYVVTFDGTSWRIADDPQPGVQDRSSKGSFMPAFGDALYRRLHVPIGVAAVGAGSTSVRQWLMKGETFDTRPSRDSYIRSIGPNQWECTGQLFDGLMRRISALGPQGFRAVLWHQGESDSSQAPEHQFGPEQYRAMLSRIIRASKTQAGWDFPWFVAQVSYHSPTDRANAAFRAAQKSLWDDGTALQGPDTDTLTEEFRAGIHFNEKGLKAHGELWAERVGAYLDELLKTGQGDKETGGQGDRK